MHLGLPIVCPDLPYARALCGSGAIYFNLDSVESLYEAISNLHIRLLRGWRPDWSIQISKLPMNWNDVANEIKAVLFNYLN
jgi:hypothetical protein